MGYAFDTTDFIAELTFRTNAEGRRKMRVASGYRPHIEFEGYPEYITSGQQIYLGQDTVEPGETVLAKISIMSKDYFKNKLYENMTFKFCEGVRVIGHGKVLEVIIQDFKKEDE